MLYLCLIIIAQCCIPSSVYGVEIARCVCGEAEGEGFDGQVAVAQAIKNRGTLTGVYGCKSTREITESCLRATNVAKRYPDIIEYADHWLSDDDLKNPPAWIKKCRKTVKIGKHTFYKCGE